MKGWVEGHPYIFSVDSTVSISHQPLIPCYVSGVHVRALIDTGSMKSFISAPIFNKISPSYHGIETLTRELASTTSLFNINRTKFRLAAWLQPCSSLLDPVHNYALEQLTLNPNRERLSRQSPKRPEAKTLEDLLTV